MPEQGARAGSKCSEHFLAPLERPYSGFYPYTLQSTEIALRTPEHIDLFNNFLVRP